MTSSSTTSARVWSIVLAGGEGEQVQPLIHRWLGQQKPKQFCTFVGTRSMFQHTLDRATQVTPPERTITVIARRHRREAWAQLEGRTVGTVLVQPWTCGLAAAILLPLTDLRVRDPHATVVILPSDQFVYPEDRFIGAVRHAVGIVERFEDRLVLLGVRPDGLELDYGWIEPGHDLSRSQRGPRVRTVRRFKEKPTAADADALLASGALWNTLVLASKVETLWRLAWRCVPDTMALLARYADAIATSREGKVLEAVYRAMPDRNFSASVLERVSDRIAVIQMDDVLWSDWGKPYRIANTLRRIAREPAFPLACLGHSLSPIMPSSGVA